MTGSMKPKWIVYDRSGGTYPVALDTALDWDMLRDYCVQRMLPGPWETIRCSNLLTAQDIAIWLNGRAGEAG